jgi:glycosyltransferase involved in cell wall biosynthesis
MKVCYIYRENRQSGYSIEEVFANVRRALSTDIEQLEYIVNSDKSKWWNIRQVGNLDADVYHITGDCNYMALGLPANKTILTIHDLGHFEVTLKGLKKWVYWFFWWALPLRKAKTFTTVSSFTKSKVLQYFKWLKSEQVNVVFNPLNNKFVYSPKEELPDQINIIQIGSGRNKNINNLIQAVKGLDVTLILVREPDELIVKDLLAKQIKFHWHSNVSQSQLQSLYEECDIVYFASTYEGFGLPIIEGQIVGRPSITSNLCSMPEVAGKGAYLVDPNSITEIKESIEFLSQKKNWVAEVKRGLINSKRFNSETIAKQYEELYSKIVEN